MVGTCRGSVPLDNRVVPRVYARACVPPIERSRPLDSATVDRSCSQLYSRSMSTQQIPRVEYDPSWRAKQSTHCANPDCEEVIKRHAGFFWQTIRIDSRRQTLPICMNCGMAAEAAYEDYYLFPVEHDDTPSLEDQGLYLGSYAS